MNANLITTSQSIDFVKKHFARYYETSNITLPDRFGKREFAFVLFSGKGMLRHISFARRQEIKKFLLERVPTHVYYSTAFYQKPDAPTMQEKGWMGAELIFDLDSDHLPNASKMSYEKQLSMVKKEFCKLVNDFLINDFGFDEKNIELYFSGGRGYHCHVKDSAIFHLDSNERREIVDYITGRDIQESIIFREHVTSTIRIRGRQVPNLKTLKMPKPTEPGWRGRISRGIIELVDEIKSSNDPLKKLKEYGVNSKDAEKLLSDFSDERVDRIREGNLDQSKTIRKFFLNSALRKTAVDMGAGETDEPVTCDVKRLIRLPSSLHGKTGFKVTKIKLDDLEEFDPLRDSVVFSDSPVKIQLIKSIKIKMMDEEFNLRDEIEEVPAYLAIFLIGRKMANLL
jgi:DNA primase small subunit